MSAVYLVRHGRAAAGWDDDPDPDLDEIGIAQAEQMAATLAPLGPVPLVTSPLLRCRRTAEALERRWSRASGSPGSSGTPVIAEVEPIVAEIPSPEGVAMGQRVPWLRRAIEGTWTELGPRYTGYRDRIVQWVSSRPSDTVVVSHFVAINAVIGACVGDDRVVVRRLDNCSVTRVQVADGELHLIEAGGEADTLIR